MGLPRQAHTERGPWARGASPPSTASARVAVLLRTAVAGGYGVGLKLKKFEIWKEMLPLIKNKSYLDPVGLSQINSLKDQIKKLN